MDFYELITFLLTSARGCVDEPKIYGPLRLLDGTKRLIDLLEAREMADDFLRHLNVKIEEAENVVLRDEKRFVQLLDDLVVDMAREVARW
jgi:hypothetical protein